MLERDIVKSLLEVEDLPTLPAVMNQILETVASETSSAQDLTAILECDHAISARILKLANSAFYGLRHKPDTIKRAVVVVGFEAVRMLALATSVFDSLSKRKQFALNPEDFWLHSLGSAKACQLLAKAVGGVESPDACFTAGLLHDMGKYILALALKEQYQTVVEEAQQSAKALHEVEQERLGATHAAVGMWMGGRWNLPELFKDVMGFQYLLQEYKGPLKTEVALAAVSSDLSRKAGFGDAGDCDPVDLGPQRLERVGFEEDQVNAVLDELAEYEHEARQFLEELRGT